MDTLDSDYSDDGYLTGKACPHAPSKNDILYACNNDECEGVVEGGALEGAEMEVEAPQSGNGEEGEGSSLDGEG